MSGSQKFRGNAVAGASTVKHLPLPWMCPHGDVVGRSRSNGLGCRNLGLLHAPSWGIRYAWRLETNATFTRVMMPNFVVLLSNHRTGVGLLSEISQKKWPPNLSRSPKVIGTLHELRSATYDFLSAVHHRWRGSTVPLYNGVLKGKSQYWSIKLKSSNKLKQYLSHLVSLRTL